MNTQTHGYRGIQIGLHWLIAVLVLVQLVFGESMTTYVDAIGEGRPLSSLEATLGSVHYWVGIAVLALVVVRLGVRLYYGAPPVDVTTPRWMILAARATHVAFYALLAAVPVSGLLAYYVWDWMGDIHAWAKPVFFVLIGVHAAAALFHQFVLKDGLLRRMLVPISDPN